MSVQYIIGASGSGKTHYLKKYISDEACKNPDKSYIMICPEQSTMQLQQEMTALHPGHGFTNIDIIGFNRLAYRIFEEKNVHVNKVLEDFGKSMLIRGAAGSMREKLRVYGGCIDKHGFIDEAKSLMSELFSYNISEEDIRGLTEKLPQDSLLSLKLSDMLVIYEEFEKRISENYIVAEKLLELMYEVADDSDIIKGSIICFDGFTGFTPVQLKLIEKIIRYAEKVIFTVTIDIESYARNDIKEHELFRLSFETLQALNRIADAGGISRENDVLLDRSDAARFAASTELMHLEKNIFRYPFRRYEHPTGDIHITECRNPREEYRLIAAKIRKLVKSGKRYRDIAVVTGNLSAESAVISGIFDEYDIPCFMDYNRGMNNNPFIDSLLALIELMDKNYNYESVFSFLKTGVTDIENDHMEDLENYAIMRGLRGHAAWQKPIKKQGFEAAEEARLLFLQATESVYAVFKDRSSAVRDYVEVLYDFMERYNFREKTEEKSITYRENGMLSEAKTFEGLYGKIIEIFNKMLEIMPDEKVSLNDFKEILKVGMNEISMGIIPPAYDMVIVGDINRTRLADISVLFFAEVNDGIVPAYGNSSRIINDRDRELMASHGIRLAPTEKVNSFYEQFYLYLNMTKPKNLLMLSYSLTGTDGKSMRPSYIVDRLTAIFPDLRIEKADINSVIIKEGLYGTYESDIPLLISTVRKLRDEGSADGRGTDGGQDGMSADGRGTDGGQDGMSADGMNTDCRGMAAALYEVYREYEDGRIPDIMRAAMSYSNRALPLSEEARAAININLINQSVSKLEKYAACAYAYFLQYGLGLKEREQHRIDAGGMGSILHKALELSFSRVKREYENDWSRVSDAERDEIVSYSIKRACEEEKNELFKEKGRVQYVEDMLLNIGRRTVKTLQHQIVSGSMRPEYFELYFSGAAGLQSAVISTDDRKINLSGIMDRADIYDAKEKDEIYVKLTDYKSGNKQFKLSHIYEGLDLQLVVYMNILLEIVARDYPGRKVVPAGMFYYHADNPITEFEAEGGAAQSLEDYKRREDDFEEDILKASRLTGLVNTDGDIPEILENDIKKNRKGNIIPLTYTKELQVNRRMSSSADTVQFDNLCSFAVKKMEEMSEKITAGEIEKNPIKKSQKVQCEYCPYREVCRFDNVNADNKIRRLKLKSDDKEEFWSRIEKEGEKDE